MSHEKHFLTRILTIVLFGLLARAGVAGPIPFRGVVEGYYGRPWGTEGRLSLLEFMGKYKMNCFIYGPKDDPYHHGRWREPYPEAEMHDFAKLLAVAKKHNIDFYWAIHLGGAFRKGNEADFDALFAKLESMYRGGFRAFAVFFDDFGGSDAEFHAEICNRVLTDFLAKKKDCAPLIMCPNRYWGSGHDYQKTLGTALDPAVHIMWTGGWICSDINARDVERVTEDFRRKPFIWWNWPVNDYCRTKLLLGRCYGLNSTAIAGLVSNPMENCEANKIALYGVAKWCLDPEGFDSQKTWEESFGKIYKDPEIAAAMRVFAEHNSDQGPNGHGYRREESVKAAPLIARAREEWKRTGKVAPETDAELRTLFKEIGKAVNTLLKKLPSEKGLGWEIRGWLEVEKYQMMIGLRTLDLLEAPTAKARRRILVDMKKIRAKEIAAIEAHREKFAAATFSGDKGHIRQPIASNRELKPFIDAVWEAKLRELFKDKTGEDISAREGLRAFSAAKGLPKLVANLDGKYAGLSRVLENSVVKPGESFGIAVPQDWQTDYFHARFGDDRASKAGIIEVSRDGETWEKLATRNGGPNMELPLKPEDGWKFARYRNTSEKPVKIKIELFKFDIRGTVSVIDTLLKEL